MKKSKIIENMLFKQSTRMRLSYNTIDHTRHDGDNFIAEPYQMGFKDLKNLISFCEESGITFYITGGSEWNPPSTIKIVYSLDIAKNTEKIRQVLENNKVKIIQGMTQITNYNTKPWGCIERYCDEKGTQFILIDYFGLELYLTFCDEHAEEVFHVIHFNGGS